MVAVDLFLPADVKRAKGSGISSRMSVAVHRTPVVTMLHGNAAAMRSSAPIRSVPIACKQDTSLLRLRLITYANLRTIQRRGSITQT